MPLVRFPVRNEYSLGQPELYKEVNREDPKAILDGVAVAGLVGILRQLGDLAEFAAEVFHGLQEQVITTASRSRKLLARVQHIETTLPPLEKAILAQTSHIHFAYTAGHEWHPRLWNEQNHFVYNDLPRFIMDSYEECRDPPRLHLLDKFDAGGPGSCLKRYSDPTFFKRVSGSPIEANAEKVQRDKKSRKSKKKRSSQRNGEISRAASISNQSSRMQFASPIVNERTSSSQTASTVEMAVKSDMGDHSNSFDSRSGSEYIECDFNLSSSMQGEIKESKESFSRLTEHVDTFGSVSSDERTHVIDDNFPYCPPPEEQAAPRPYCVTWDEKAEIVNSKALQCDRDEAPEMLETNFGLDTRDMGATNLRSADRVDTLFDDLDTPKSIAIRNQLNEIESEPEVENEAEVESEPDNYMDALNTIESESENDIDYQTKREVDEYSYDVNNDRIEDGMHDLMAHSPDHDQSIIESHTASDIPTNDGITCSLPDSVSSENFAAGQMPQVSGRYSDSDHSPGTDFGANDDILNGSKVGYVATDPSPSSSGSGKFDSQNPLGDSIISSVCEPQESHDEFSSVHSVKIWTNGGLLGLEPSKPPDFAVPSNVVQDFVSKSEDEVDGRPNGQKDRLGKLVENAPRMQKVPSFSNEMGSLPLADLDAKLEKSGDAQHSKTYNHANGAGLTIAGIVTPGSELLASPDVKGRPAGSNQENDENSSALFGFSHRLLVNGFRRKVSLVHDGKSEPASTLKTEVMEWRGDHHSISYKNNHETTFKELFVPGSPLDSLTSSPPLEHMKISFNPIDSFEYSKLKLKFPDGNERYENVKDMFPSFQLVPEPALPQHDNGSDSDDDTFCRSSPYMSDDGLSHLSESNSEQWESGETPDSKDHELYDALCRISSMESVSGSLQVEGTANSGIHVDGGLKSIYTENGTEHSLSGPLFDLPSFDAVNPALRIKTKDNSDSKNLLEVQSPVETNPSPPPLPPVQWRVSKTQSDLLEVKEHTLPNALKHAFDQKLPGSADAQQPMAALADEKQSNEDTAATKQESKPDQRKLNGQKEANQAANGKGMDEKENFLHQIRTKSLNLRRTVTARPTVASGPTTNVQVNAILQKANAIRRAVASDDGEDDDNWSDI